MFPIVARILPPQTTPRKSPPSIPTPASSLQHRWPGGPPPSQTPPFGRQPDIDAGIVTRVPSIPGEIAEGTLVKAKLREQLSTLSTQPGYKVHR